MTISKATYGNAWNDLINVHKSVRIPSPRLNNLTNRMTRNKRKNVIDITPDPFEEKSTFSLLIQLNCHLSIELCLLFFLVPCHCRRPPPNTQYRWNFPEQQWNRTHSMRRQSNSIELIKILQSDFYWITFTLCIYYIPWNGKLLAWTRILAQKWRWISNLEYREHQNNTVAVDRTS